MTVRNDPHIAALIVELVESSPEAPRFDELEKLATQPVGAGRVRPLQTVKPTRNRGWIVGIAAAAVTLILVGGVVWLVPFGGQTPPASENSPPTTVEVTPTTEPAITTDTVPATTTTLTAVPVVPPGEGPKLSFVQAEAPTDGRWGSGVWFDGALYVLSSSDGTQDARELFRTKDGFTWELVPGLPGATSVRHSMLQTDGDLLVNVVMPSDGSRGIRSDAFIQVNTSTNGTDWISSSITLPVPIGSNLAGEFQLGEDFFFSDNFAVGPKGIVVTATIDLVFEGEGFANSLVDPDEGIHVEVVDLDLDRGVMIVQFLDENNDMEQIGDLREFDLNALGFSGAFSNLIDAMNADPNWKPQVDGFLAQSSASVGYAWFSPDGTTWETVSRGGPLDGGEFSSVLATSDGFVATAANHIGSTSLPPDMNDLADGFDSTIVWESDDGTTWTKASGLISRHGAQPSKLVEWKGAIVEHVRVGTVRSASDDTEVWTLASLPEPVFPDVPTDGMLLSITDFGLFGSPSYGWWGPDATELLFSTDGTAWNRWEPTEFDIGGPRDEGSEHSGDAWVVGTGDDFIVIQQRERDESSAYSLWVGAVL
jgi:hypothetical protein